jgi:trimeric autotransporter adhesin
LLIILGLGKASATTYVWSGTSGGVWNSASNWVNQTTYTNNGYPGSAGTGDIADIYTSTTINYSGIATSNSIATINLTYGGATVVINLVNSTTTPVLNITNGITIPGYAGDSFSFTTTSSAATVNINGSMALGANNTFSVGSNITMGLSSGSMTESGAVTFSNAGNITTNSFPITFSSNSGTQSYTNTGTITANSGVEFDYGNFSNSGTMTIQNASLFTLTSNTYSFTNTGTINILPNTALTANSSLVIAGSLVTFQNTYTSAALPGAINITGISGNTTALFTISANGSIATSGSITATNAPILWSANSFSSIQNTTTHGVITLTSSPLTLSYGTTFTNTGKIIATSSPLNMGTSSNGVNITNTSPGSIQLSSSSTFNYPGNSVSFQNTGNVTVTSSNMNFTGNVNYFQNSSPGVVAISGSAMTFSTQCYISNNSSATFTVNGSSTITLNGAAYISNSGTFNAGTSNSSCIINAAGPGYSSPVTITNTSPGNFNVGSTSVINLTGTVSGNPTIFNNSSGTTTLMSDQYGSATIGTLGSGASCQGTFNVQRYITGGYRGYRLFSCPVNTNAYTFSSSNVIDISYLGSSTYTSGEFIAGPGSGFGSNGTLSHTNANPTIYLYQESALPGSTYNNTFISGKNIGISSIGTNSVTTTSTTTNGVSTSGVKIPVGNGYISYFIGPYNVTTYTSTSPTTATTTAPGYVNQGNITLYVWGTSPSSTLTYTTTTGNRNPGYTMVGNPYPSTLDLYAFYNDTYNSSNNQKVINPSFYELNDQSQSYVTYNTGTGSSGTGNSRYVASGQGFFVSVVSTISSVSNKTLTFTESDKPSSTTAAIFPPTLLLAAVPPSQQTGVSTGLHLKLSMDSINYDECGIYFRSDWKDTYDEKTDSYDLDGTNPKVFLSSYSSDSVRTSVNALSNYTYGKRIKLFVKGVSDGIYNLNLEDLLNIDTTNFNIYLIDKKLNDSLDMVHYKTYTFNLYTADTADFANRFVLALERKPMAPYSLITFGGQKATGGILLNWNTVNEGDFTSFGLQKLNTSGEYASIDSVQSNGSGVYSFNDQNPIMGNNIYRLAQNDIHGNVTFSSPININYNTISVSGMFTIYPNPSKDMINIAVNSGIVSSKNTPTYLANIYDLSGAVMNTKQVNTNNWTQDITSYKAGVYILELKTTAGDVVGKAKFVKTN